MFIYINKIIHYNTVHHWVPICNPSLVPWSSPDKNFWSISLFVLLKSYSCFKKCNEWFLLWLMFSDWSSHIDRDQSHCDKSASLWTGRHIKGYLLSNTYQTPLSSEDATLLTYRKRQLSLSGRKWQQVSYDRYPFVLIGGSCWA